MGCPVHNLEWKTVPAGVSKSTGKSYDAFQACPARGCREKPGRAGSAPVAQAAPAKDYTELLTRIAVAVEKLVEINSLPKF